MNRHGAKNAKNGNGGLDTDTRGYNEDDNGKGVVGPRNHTDGRPIRKAGGQERQTTDGREKAQDAQESGYRIPELVFALSPLGRVLFPCGPV